MDNTERKITKIAREVSAFTVQTMKAEGVGTAEFDFIHLVRHHPGLTQSAALRHGKGGIAEEFQGGDRDGVLRMAAFGAARGGARRVLPHAGRALSARQAGEPRGLSRDDPARGADGGERA